jgi:hypothetical protein
VRPTEGDAETLRVLSLKVTQLVSF